LGAGDGRALLLGDWNKNGLVDNGENALVVSIPDGLTFLNASAKVQQDGRWQLVRDVTAAWLNYLTGAPVGDADAPSSTDPADPKFYLQEAIDFLAKFGDQAINDGALDYGRLTVSDLSAATKIATDSTLWKSFPLDGIDADAVATLIGTDIADSGVHLHTSLDNFNNGLLIPV
jgi:hypothetical protein